MGGIIAVVFADGGMGDVGKHVVGQALKSEGLSVRAVARDPDTLTNTASSTKPFIEEAGDRIQFIKLDPVTDRAGLEAAFQGACAVVSCVGCRQLGKERCALSTRPYLQRP
jgi:uncharacterized protein YbjT (DUF2867 family)